MMPTIPVFVSDAVVSAIPSLPLGLPIGIQLAALVPVAFAAGLFALLLGAIRVTRSAERRAQAPRIPARSAA